MTWLSVALLFMYEVCIFNAVQKAETFNHYYKHKKELFEKYEAVCVESYLKGAVEHKYKKAK